VPEHFFRDDMATLPCIVTFISDAQIACFLQTKGRHKSVFERLKILDSESKPYFVTSHAFRHYLNTIAKDGELPELDIARWSVQAHRAERRLRPHRRPAIGEAHARDA
jgi:hypothetical protein